MLKVAIAGAAGFVGGELLRLLINHPNVGVVVPQSDSQSGKQVSTIHEDLFHLDLKFAESFDEDIDVLFVSKGHGWSRDHISSLPGFNNAVVIDMSSDFRVEGEGNPFTYGLPEWQRNKIAGSDKIANCGCFATAIQLALLPLYRNHVVEDEIHVHGITGSTGAGASKIDTTHFSWRDSNVSIYKAFEHQHLDEVYQMANSFMPSAGHKVNFIPVRGNFTRGILVSAYTRTNSSIEELNEIFKSEYRDEPFVTVTDNPVHLKQVINTNHCLIKVDKYDDKVMVTSCIDNLLKGAAGQAVQNMNIRLGFPENSGLILKAKAF